MKIGLVKGRHELPVKDYIFEKDIEDVRNIEAMYNIVSEKLNNFDKREPLEVYVTGLTVALTTVIRYCYNEGLNLILWHYDKQKNDYYAQVMFDSGYCSYCKQNSIKENFCTICGAS